MARSQEIAAAVALRKLGYHVDVQENGALVVRRLCWPPADGSAWGRRDRRGRRQACALDDRSAEVDQLAHAGRCGHAHVAQLSCVRNVRHVTAANPRRPYTGRRRVLVEAAADIKLPFKVRIDAGNIGGPSAGLAFALDVMEKLGRDVDTAVTWPLR